ncbi:MAG: FecR family protein, partial [Bdellovibrionota bacterium]
MKKLGFLVLFGLAVGASRADAACGTFEVAKGDIKVQSAGKVVPVSTGGKICSGDTVISGSDSRAKIKMADGNELNISPDSKIVIEDYQYDKADNKKKVLLNILKGKVRATTREDNMYTDKAKDGQANTFQIRTKSAVAGVRGTDFLTSFDPSTNKTGVVTFKGKVEFGSVGKDGKVSNSVQVTAGLSTSMVGGQAPEPPKPVPPSELKSLNSETRAESAGGTGQNDNGRGPEG